MVTSIPKPLHGYLRFPFGSFTALAGAVSTPWAALSRRQEGIAFPERMGMAGCGCARRHGQRRLFVAAAAKGS
jgi:hypothetical protein